MGIMIDGDALKLKGFADPETGEGILYVQDIDDAHTVEAVSKGLFDQIKWERDIAIGQLKEIGCELGQKMDDVKARLEAVPVHGRWENDENDIPRCSNCSYIPEFNRYLDDYYYSDFCPNCGAKMNGTEEPESAKCGTTGLKCIRCNPGPCGRRKDG